MSSAAVFVPFVRAVKKLVAAPIYCLSLSFSQDGLAALGEEARGLALAQPISDPNRAISPLLRDFRVATLASKIDITLVNGGQEPRLFGGEDAVLH